MILIAEVLQPFVQFKFSELDFRIVPHFHRKVFRVEHRLSTRKLCTILAHCFNKLYVGVRTLAPVEDCRCQRDFIHTSMTYA